MRDFFKAGLKLEQLWLFGMLVLFGNGAISHAMGEYVRYASLAGGFLIIFGSALKRGAFVRKSINYIFLSLLCGYSVILFMWPYLREHLSAGVFQSTFSLIIFCLFIAGYLIGKSSRSDALPLVGIVHLGFILIAALSSYNYLGYVKHITFSGGGRDLETGNPVGIAYIFTLFSLVLLYLLVLYKNTGVKLVAGFGLIFAGLIVMSTGSRGAVLWGGCACAYVLFVLFRSGRIRLTLGKLAFAVGAVLVGGLLIYLLSLVNYAVAERWHILAHRFIGLFRTMSGEGNDMATIGRLYIYDFYLNTFSQWIFIGSHNYSSYPHNQILEILVRFGLYGIPLLLLSLFAFSRMLYFSIFNVRGVFLNREWYLFALLFVFCYLQSMSSLSLEINRGLWLGMGYLVGYDYKGGDPLRRL